MSKQTYTPAGTQDHLPWLDGLRGIAALWVLASHVQILTGLRNIPVLSWGGVAVDLFMLLSGFLMAHNYFLRQRSEPWESPRTFFLFWLRRFFRIAPLYYVLLIVAFSVGALLAQDRMTIAALWPSTASPLQRYLDGSAANYLTHLSFLFGFMPDYAFRTPLPDWSIGLEMQFYLVFPFIMLALARLGPLLTTLAVLAVCVVARLCFPEYFQRFEMPAFIAMKLYVFMAGIWIAVARKQKSMTLSMLAGLGIMLVWALADRTFHVWEPRAMTVGRLLIVAAMFYLMNNGTLPGSMLLQKPTAVLRAWLSGRVARFLGDTSYCAYLLHLLIVLPVAGALARNAQYIAMPAALRFLLALALILPPVYLLSWGLFHTVEKFGIHMGRVLVRKLSRGTPRGAALPGESGAGDKAAHGIPR
jgi:peptidoglycan/LPS O-acetylase OafA/YrhL